MTKVAISKGTLWIPPTYFALEHAQAMPTYEWRAFTLTADISDPRITVPVIQAVRDTNLPRRTREFLKWTAQGRMASDIVRWQPDIIHQHQATWSLPAVRASQKLGAPLVTTLHGSDSYEPSAPTNVSALAGEKWNRRNRRAAFDHSHLLLAVSRSLADRALASGAPSQRLLVHYQGVDTDYWSPSPGVRVDDGLTTLVFVGALSALKGIEELVHVSCGLVDDHPHQLVIIGDGPLRSRIATLVQEYPHIRMCGVLPSEAVREHLRDADALVLPTRSTQGRTEAAGLVLLEAQSCGIPVVTNRVGGTTEMGVEGETALYCDQTDPMSLARNVRNILDMSWSDRQAMGLAARKWVVAHRSTQQAISELHDIYLQL
ncbi:glycosyltransferase family 4 protein [Schaalia vaccimaxillae]|uniref:glycosyltransferase family 4 protein n=1 Tax=Schaalia vaccimaxillae TaxID=183916 RepID=UPI0003B6B4C6|nr:glycosyltransferase family 4 protein [Schaalia vaccimaxillae]